MELIQDESSKVPASPRALASLAGSACSDTTLAPPCKKDRRAGEPIQQAFTLTC